MSGAPLKYAGAFSVGAEVKEGKSPEDVETGIYAEIEKLKEEPVPAEELQKVKNNCRRRSVSAALAATSTSCSSSSTTKASATGTR